MTISDWPKVEFNALTLHITAHLTDDTFQATDYTGINTKKLALDKVTTVKKNIQKNRHKKPTPTGPHSLVTTAHMIWLMSPHNHGIQYSTEHF